MSTENVKTIKVEVSYARPDTQVILEVDASAEASVEEIIKLSGIIEKFPEIDLAENKVGIFGKLTKLTNNALRDGNRIEIYRKLIADPKEVRRKRAAEGKKTKKGGGDI